MRFTFPKTLASTFRRGSSVRASKAPSSASRAEESHGERLPAYEHDADRPPAYSPDSYKAKVSDPLLAKMASTKSTSVPVHDSASLDSLLSKANAHGSDGAYHKMLATLRSHETNSVTSKDAVFQIHLGVAYKHAALQAAQKPTRSGFHFTMNDKSLDSVALHSDALSLLSGAIEASAAELHLLRDPAARNKTARTLGEKHVVELERKIWSLSREEADNVRTQLSQPSSREALVRSHGEEHLKQIEKQAVHDLTENVRQGLDYIANIGQAASDLSTLGRLSIKLKANPAGDRHARALVLSTSALRKQMAKQGVPPKEFWKQWTQREQNRFLHSKEVTSALEFSNDGVIG